MYAMLLAAGFGKRLNPLTLTCPKPLIKLNNKELILYNIENLRRSGFTNIVINLHYLGKQIKDFLSDGSKYGVNICYSEEEQILNTGGGIKAALSHIKTDQFLVVSADLVTNYDFSKLHRSWQDVHIVMVQNPGYHPRGDYAIQHGRLKFGDGLETYTYSNIGVFSASWFLRQTDNIFPLKAIIDAAIMANNASAELFDGMWHNIGSIDELNTAELAIQAIQTVKC